MVIVLSVGWSPRYAFETVKDFQKDYERDHLDLLSPDKVLKRFSPDDIVNHLSPENLEKLMGKKRQRQTEFNFILLLFRKVACMVVFAITLEAVENAY
ncbi:MAG: hypothetical protein L0Y39_08640 [Methylococcaceae bacterium]|nr:hypothetical protein [Methylococcaceae bacterium]